MTPLDTYDIVIRGGMALTLNADVDTIDNALVGIQDGRITLIETDDPAHPLPLQAKTVIDATGCLVMPGLVNTHTHLPMVCFRGMADDLPLMQWLHDHIFPAERRHVNREMVTDAALLAMAEMILSGTTTFCDGYFYESSIGRAALACGMRAVISQGFADFATPDNPDVSKMMEVADRFVSLWKDRHPTITPAFFCHSPYTCSPQTLVTVKNAAREAGLLYQIHLLENQDEIGIIEARYGKKPVPHLADLGVLDDRTLAVHCNWLTDEDMDLFSRLGVSVSHNPGSSMKLAAGIAPVPAMLKRGIRVGLGTDGAASNNRLDLFGEMDLTAKLHKVASLDPTVMDARTVVHMATAGGASLLGLSDRIGTLACGKEADIIVIQLRQPHLTPLYDPYSHLVYAARGADVQTSIIAGQIVMRDRKLLTMDLKATMEKVRYFPQLIKHNRPTSP